LVTTPVNQAANSHNFSAKIFNDIDCFLNLSASGHDIFGHDKALTRRNLKSASQNQFSILFLGENMAFTEDSPNFLSNDNAAHGWRNDGITFHLCEFRCKVATNFRRNVGVLQDQSALEVLPAVQAGAENEVAIQQRTCFLERF
jgi:hypothetical protein